MFSKSQPISTFLDGRWKTIWCCYFCFVVAISYYSQNLSSKTWINLTILAQRRRRMGSLTRGFPIECKETLGSAMGWRGECEDKIYRTVARPAMVVWFGNLGVEKVAGKGNKCARNENAAMILWGDQDGWTEVEERWESMNCLGRFKNGGYTGKDMDEGIT